MYQIDMRSSVPIYEQLASRVTEMVAAGVLRPDDCLPSTRAMAGALGINPNTVQKAYSVLELEGIIYQIPGRGSFVSGEQDIRSIITSKHKKAVHQALLKAKSAGMTRCTADEIVASVYEEGKDK